MSDPIAVQLRALADQLDARAPAAPAAPADPLAGTFLNIAGATGGYQPPSAEPADGSWHWERNNMGWIKVAGAAPAVSAPRPYAISTKPYPLSNTGEAALYPALVAVWNSEIENNGPVAAWRAANKDFNDTIKNARMSICALLLQQYPQDAADIRWSNDSAEAGA